MESTFIDGQWFVVNKFIYLLHPPERYDIIQLFDADTEQLFVKRVIGLPGETVVINNNSVFIRSVDGTDVPLPEPYLDPEDLTTVLFGAQNKFVIPEHSYFVLGDNRLFSRDSREFGPVHRKDILGKVLLSW